jgi:hypothetical protein
VPSLRAFGLETTRGPNQSGSFPETNFFAGFRQMAGCACALKGVVVFVRSKGWQEWDWG